MHKIIQLILYVFITFSNAYAAIAAIDKSSYPIKPGEIGPVAPGNLQYPFLCQTITAGLGDPVIDNQSERGTPVKDSSGKIVGYSVYCGSPMRIDYFYKPLNKDEYLPLPKDDKGNYQYPPHLDKTYSGNKYIVRIERGTINRFMYVIAMLQDPVAHLTPQQSGYKNRAIFDFLGGTGVGYSQASNSASRVINEPHRLVEDLDPITLGYAVLFTTGNATSTQYNLKLGLMTAQMVKEQLIAEFGKLQYTLAYGGSGGAVEQYVYAQLDPTFIDGSLTVAAYADFITQPTYASDCPLLEYYFDNLALDKPTPWAKRQLIEGFAASANMPASELGRLNPQTVKIRSTDGKFGSDTCINGWGGAIPQVMNPRYPTVTGIDVIKIQKPIDWSEWGSESNQWQFGTYPTNAMNITPNTVDNQGVQYGLIALKNGDIDKETFFDLNKKVGGWKPADQFEQENGFPMSGPDKTYDGWSSKNATAASAFVQGKTAPRTEADPDAVDAAEKSETVLQGNLDLPIIDVKGDAENAGNMHSLIHSFVIRARLAHYGKAGNQVIWIARLSKPTTATKNLSMQAMDTMALPLLYSARVPKNLRVLPKKPGDIPLRMMQEWVENIKNHPEKKIAENKPWYLADGCFYKDSWGIPHFWFSNSVWDGIIDPTKAKGYCAQHFDIHPTPRMMAGGSFSGQTFKCSLEPIEKFIEEGGYGKVIMSDMDIKQLKDIFPAGVCKMPGRESPVMG
jgi:hypothetical protein